ncbi:MAG: ankyrin repeat domain-containing protein [Limisphaerales bacterium]
MNAERATTLSVQSAAATGATSELEKEFALLKAQMELAQSETNRLLLFESVGDKRWLDDFGTCQLIQSRLENAKAGGKSEWTVAELEKSVETMKDKLKADYDHWLVTQQFRSRYLELAIAQTRSLTASNPVTNSRASVIADDEEQEIRRIQQMIQNSPDLINARVNTPTGQGNTPLVTAAYSGWLKVAAYLLEHGADINAGGGEALISAIRVGNRAMVEFLLSHGANVNSKDESINGWGTSGQTALHIAASKNFQAVTEVLLANKADVNAQDNLGNTALSLAAKNGQAKIIKMLLDAGASPNQENNDGRTPLSFAVESGSPEIIKMLLAAKADPNGGKLDVPLLVAIHSKDVTTAELLLQAGANLNAKGEDDWQPSTLGAYGRPMGRGWETPLSLAVSTKQLPMIQLLLKYKADPNDSQTDGSPLLFNALSDTNILKILLEAGTKVDVRDATGPTYNGKSYSWTPLMFAIANRYSADTVKILLQHGANPNLRDEYYGWTPLQFITWSGQLPDPKVLELLLDTQADPNARDNGGNTALSMLKQKMVESGISEQTKTQANQLADMLRQHGALDKLPDWDRITVSRPSDNFFTVGLSKRYK